MKGFQETFHYSTIENERLLENFSTLKKYHYKKKFKK